MAQTTSDITFVEKPMGPQLDAFFTAIGQGFNSHTLRRQRMGRIQRLNALGDADLARLGLTRAQIPAHVFRDLLG